MQFLLLSVTTGLPIFTTSKGGDRHDLRTPPPSVFGGLDSAQNTITENGREDTDVSTFMTDKDIDAFLASIQTDGTSAQNSNATTEPEPDITDFDAFLSWIETDLNQTHSENTLESEKDVMDFAKLVSAMEFEEFLASVENVSSVVQGEGGTEPQASKSQPDALKRVKRRNPNARAFPPKDKASLTQCPICGKEHPYPKALTRHLISHSSERNFPCPECGKCFKSMHDTKRHMKCHSGERPFECQYCDKAFRTKQIMRGHELTHFKHVRT